MPTVSYTSEQISAVAEQYTNAPRDSVLSRFLEIKLHHVRSPQSWTMAEAIQHAKNRINANLQTEGFKRLSYRSLAVATFGYEALMNHRRHMYDLGKEIADCFKQQDDARLASLLNENDSVRDGRSSGDWVDILNDCDKFPNGPQYETCSDCNYIEAEDDGTWIYQGDRWVCSDCRENSYRWSDYHDCVVHEDDEEPSYDNDDDDDDGDNDPSIIGQYHSSRRKLGLIPTKFSQRETKVYLGLELEMEVSGNLEEKAKEVMDAVGQYQVDGTSHNYCFLEGDGSLNHGFEMVTGYTGLDVHAKQLAFFKNHLEGVKSHDTKTCGLHVHICKKGMTMFHAAKLILFMHDSHNQKLFRTVARRTGNRFAQFKNKTSDYTWLKHGKRAGMQSLNEERYESVNFQPERTVEFRLFKGTLRYETIMACLEFTYMAWFFSRDTGAQDLTTPNFLKYISRPDNRKDTANLRSYLRSKGFSLEKAAVVKPNPRVAQVKQTEEV